MVHTHYDNLNGRRSRITTKMGRAILFSKVIRSFCISMIGIILGLLTTYGAEADVRIEGGGRFKRNIFISGKITENDAKELDNISSQLEHVSTFEVWLDSPGGELGPALRIGRIIRKHEGHTIIGPSEFARCYSSCALIFIAGVTRISVGRLGLHRPYLSSDPLRRDVIEKEIPNMFLLVKNYVAEINITDNFYQLMINTKPSEMKVFTLDDDLSEIVPTEDPVYSEIETSYKARAHGVTTAEMRRREHAVVETCLIKEIANRDPEFRCRQAIEWGLSERKYALRSKVAEKECEYSDDETLTYRESRDHPSRLRWEECVRKIMLPEPKSFTIEEFYGHQTGSGRAPIQPLGMPPVQPLEEPAHEPPPMPPVQGFEGGPAAPKPAPQPEALPTSMSP